MTITGADAATLRDGLAGYARRLHAAAGDRHHVVSPLGAWLLLALCGTGADDAGRARLAGALGCPAGDAARLAAALLARPHPLVAAGAAAWLRPVPGRPVPARLEEWQAGLPPAVQTGPVPAPAQADAWAREHSLGMIEKFPVPIGPLDYLVLATALATRVSWEVPFDRAPGAELGVGSPWAGPLRQVLRTPAGRGAAGHEQFIAVTPEAGDVIVHLAQASGGLLVASVAAVADVPPAAVLAAAQRLGSAAVTGTPVPRRAVADLPLGDAPLWRVREEPGPGRDTCAAVLPPWTARTSLELTDPSLGFAAAVAALGAGDDAWRAAQAAVARYSRTGFEAAAVTAMAVAAAAIRRPAGGHRSAVLRFAHPYAVAAVAQQDEAGVPGPWHGVPVFSAWVAEPQDAADGP